MYTLAYVLFVHLVLTFTHTCTSHTFRCVDIRAESFTFILMCARVCVCMSFCLCDDPLRSFGIRNETPSFTNCHRRVQFLNSRKRYQSSISNRLRNSYRKFRNESIKIFIIINANSGIGWINFFFFRCSETKRIDRY